MASESLALFAIDQNSHLQDARRVGRDGVDERGDGEILHENSGAVTVGEGGVEVDDGDSRIDKEDASDFGARSQRVRRGLVEIQREQGAEQFLGTLLPSGGQGDLSGLRTQGAIFIMGDEERDLFGRPRHWRSERTSVGGHRRKSRGVTAHAPDVSAHS